MKAPRVFLVLLMALSLVTVARSGHELPVYPSYYPHEIEISTVAPDRAAALLAEGKIQAYIGSEPRFANAPPDSIRTVESLGSFVLVRVNPTKNEESACAIARALVRDLAGRGEFIFHPYPVTPFHGDYLHHADLAEATKARFAGDVTASPAALKVRAKGALAQSLVRPDWIVQGTEWDAEIEAVGAAGLVASAEVAINGWLGPTWLKTGWFHAELLLADAVADPDRRDRIEAGIRRLKERASDDKLDRINSERELVGLLASCHKLVAGYTLSREYFSAEIYAGVENIAYDSLTGLNSPMFIRTVKLKDFPWNGWLKLGIATLPAAAWNPIAGFTDGFGRLTWSAVGDPALIPTPYDAGWILNRVSDVEATPKP